MIMICRDLHNLSQFTCGLRFDLLFYRKFAGGVRCLELWINIIQDDITTSVSGLRLKLNPRCVCHKFIYYAPTFIPNFFLKSFFSCIIFDSAHTYETTIVLILQ